jgi:hypothetical protein
MGYIDIDKGRGKRSLELRHVDNATDAVSAVHVVKALVDLLEVSLVGDELVDPESTLEVVLDDTGDLASALDSSKGGSSPDSASDELERSGRDLGSGRGNTYDQISS